MPKYRIIQRFQWLPKRLNGWRWLEHVHVKQAAIARWEDVEWTIPWYKTANWDNPKEVDDITFFSTSERLPTPGTKHLLVTVYKNHIPIAQRVPVIGTYLLGLKAWYIMDSPPIGHTTYEVTHWGELRNCERKVAQQAEIGEK